MIAWSHVISIFLCINLSWHGVLLAFYDRINIQMLYSTRRTGCKGYIMFGIGKLTSLPDRDQALPGRDQRMQVPATHYVNGHNMSPPYPANCQTAMFGMGCFWGAEQRYWEARGVYITAVGYASGYTPNPTYQEVCSGYTGHNEVVLVVYEKDNTSYHDLLKLFWESHDPTQGMRQGNDRGTQYRSGIYYYTEQQHIAAEQTKQQFQQCLLAANQGMITTEILPAPEFYYAEEYHQQYLAKNPGGYCGLGGTGLTFPSS
jgi:peptide-methionine (S)-S-oxide reductase